MQNQNQTTLASLWLGKNGNIFESLLFALFLFLFSFALATTPFGTFSPGAKVIASTADGIGRGYETVMNRLDRNVTLLPEITVGAQRELGVRIDRMREAPARTGRDLALLMRVRSENTIYNYRASR